MEKELKILMIEDVPADAELELRELKRAGIAYVTRRVETESDFRRELGEFMPDLILSDFTLPTFDGMSALKVAQELRPETPFLFVSGTIGEERAIEALKHGATDYVLKTNLARLSSAVRRAVEEARERARRKRAEQELRESECRFSLFMQYLPGTAFIKDREGRYRFVNQTVERVLGKKNGDIIGRTDEEVLPAEFAEPIRVNDFAVIETNRSAQAVETIPQDDGPHSWLVHRFPIPGPDADVMLLGGIAIDITERLRAEEKVARLSRIYAVLSGINSTIVRAHERQELFREACRIAVEHGGFKLAIVALVDSATGDVNPVAWMGGDEGYLDQLKSSGRLNTLDPETAWTRVIRNSRLFVSEDIAMCQNPLFKKEALERGYQSLAAFPLTVQGKAVGLLALYSAEARFFDRDEMRLLKELSGDISFALEVIEKEEKLNYLAYYDALTGLPNRSLCHDRLKRLLYASARDQTGVALIMVDLERFRIINDTLGRHAGDTLLKRIGERLRNCLNDPDAAAFLGGNTFAVLVPDIKEGAHIARILEDKILTAISEPITVDGQELRVAAKAGVALFPNDGADADTLFMNAEIALRKAKTAGDRYLFYAPQMNLRVAERLTIENKLRRAVEEKQFVLYYQPKVSLDSGHITGLEALIRWNDPDKGIAPPGTFIPFLEETGMILPVGSWALEKAASDYKRWETMGLKPPKIAVNVSPLQLRQKTFVDEVKGAIDRAAGGSAALDLEITESLIMEDIEGNIEKLKIFREMNVVVFIDDFGTGYSSLSYLAKLPVDALKIDRAFILNMASNPDDMAIVSSIISLAHALNLKVVAEGVETGEQQRLLRLLKCDEMQGYVFSKPLPPEKIEAMLGRIVPGDRS